MATDVANASVDAGEVVSSCLDETAGQNAVVDSPAAPDALNKKATWQIEQEHLVSFAEFQGPWVRAHEEEFKAKC